MGHERDQGSKCVHGMVCVARLFIIPYHPKCSLNYSTSVGFVELYLNIINFFSVKCVQVLVLLPVG
jgi:hypothetical protein